MLSSVMVVVVIGSPCSCGGDHNEIAKTIL